MSRVKILDDGKTVMIDGRYITNIGGSILLRSNGLDDGFSACALIEFMPFIQKFIDTGELVDPPRFQVVTRYAVVDTKFEGYVLGDGGFGASSARVFQSESEAQEHCKKWNEKAEKTKEES
jgi:hypothetical protein